MTKAVEWDRLPDELVDLIANHLFSDVELLRLRTICRYWRSAVVLVPKKRFPNRHDRNRKRILSTHGGKPCLLSPTAFFRVVRSSCPSKGWLIKTLDLSESESRKRLLRPLSRDLIKPSAQTLDLLGYTVSELHQSYDVQYVENSIRVSAKFARVVLVDDLVFAVDGEKKIWWCNSKESSKEDAAWTRIRDEEVEIFADIIVNKGQIYALDLKGAVWWISKSELNIFQYGPSTPLDDYYVRYNCKDKRLVEYCGDICVVHRFCQKSCVRRVTIERTVGFKVYKMNEESVEWVEVKSLGDRAFVMAKDSCFSVLASEYYGCLENSVYFTDEEEEDNVKVFKLGDGSVTKMVKSSSQSCFRFVSPPFL
ncbi:unnamed protein product [Microthlaspi erraticum]|uniref:Uncharacterized protein n=1 Tax=Microthlaspi erraticum TaxID=1685480 RepID=A0A6D2J6V5_9BRAS|nr:unnamed protein product [Microthlaspi erraticum]